MGRLKPKRTAIRGIVHGPLPVRVPDVSFAFRDVSRIPRLLLATSIVVPAHSADCDILPGELAKVHVLYILQYTYVSFDMPPFYSAKNWGGHGRPSRPCSTGP